MRTALRQMIHMVRDKSDISCRMMHKICLMLSAVINTFRNTEATKVKWTTFLEGYKGLIFNLNDTPKMKIIYGIFSRLMFLPSHYMQTFEEAFYTGYFEMDCHLFMPICKDLRARFVGYTIFESETPLSRITNHKKSSNNGNK